MAQPEGHTKKILNRLEKAASDPGELVIVSNADHVRPRSKLQPPASRMYGETGFTVFDHERFREQDER